jgi:hypothetical protein
VLIQNDNKIYIAIEDRPFLFGLVPQNAYLGCGHLNQNYIFLVNNIFDETEQCLAISFKIAEGTTYNKSF